MRDFFNGVRRHIDKLDAQHLREQYARLSDELASLDTLFETISIGIILLDENGHIAKSNPAAKDLLGIKPEDALDTLSIPIGKSVKRDIQITYPQSRTLEIKSVPIESGTLVYIDDVTAERERTEEELRTGATRAVRDLAAGVAHEIGNPLNALSLNLQLLKRISDANCEIDECLKQVERLSSIIQGFLQALRPSKPNLVRGTLADPIKSCLSTMKRLFEERSISVTLNLASSIPSVALDNAQMEQVFFNLLKNAMEAVRNGGAIDIDLSSDDNDVVTTLSDNGLGMEPEQVAHLFEPYRTSKEHGTGLGLMISSRIVRDHGGSIDVESKTGEGTTFTIRIPRIERRIRALKG